jgi:hypothetical protein
MTLVFYLGVPNDLFLDTFPNCCASVLNHRKKLASLAQRDARLLIIRTRRGERRRNDAGFEAGR